MNIIRDIAKELLSMFMADARLALSILVLVLFTSLLIKVVGIAPLLAGGGLLAGCLVILVLAACRVSHERLKKREQTRAPELKTHAKHKIEKVFDAHELSRQ